ncbi:unnamed protein product [Orchesella dallaii]|uniref:carbonic anhydrase n=1 Tax=Orchesella dallaii TaxID=48710 RepID=A0ABP1S3B8_9HEXA
MEVIALFVLLLNLVSHAAKNKQYVQFSDNDETVLHYTYGDNDKTGPLYWSALRNVNGKSVPYLPGKPFTQNHCTALLVSPLNIQSKNIVTPEFLHKGEVLEQIHADIEHDGVSQTIAISISAPEIEWAEWEFAHPTDAYHGIEVRANQLGLFQLFDSFDPIPKTDAFTTFDFHFMSIFYCDLSKAPKYRSMHQLENKRFPLELEFVFFRKPKDLGIDQPAPYEETETDDTTNPAVILTVLGEIGTEDNKYFQPVVDAAKLFHGQDFGMDEETIYDEIFIKRPWSPTWLIPDSSAYYYYNDASFPVPPCWKVERYYVLKDPINISQAQLNALTNIRTDREKGTGGKMLCTFSKVPDFIDEIEQQRVVTLNIMEHEMRGDDKKPRSEKEVLALKERRKSMDVFRRRIAGEAVYENNEVAKPPSSNAILIISPIILIPFGWWMNIN